MRGKVKVKRIAGWITTSHFYFRVNSWDSEDTIHLPGLESMGPACLLFASSRSESRFFSLFSLPALFQTCSSVSRQSFWIARTPHHSQYALESTREDAADQRNTFGTGSMLLPRRKNAAAVRDPIQLASHALLISLLSSACVDPFLTTVDPWEALRTLRSFSVLTLAATYNQN